MLCNVVLGLYMAHIWLLRGFVGMGMLWVRVMRFE